jgi:hypothetical protein
VDRPRCVEQGIEGKMFCLAAYNCLPPPLQEVMPGVFNYPPACIP